MTNIRSQNEIILSLLDFLRVAQPSLDTKAGTVSRDLIIDAPASQLSRLYDELSRIQSLQSLRLAIGSDLDNLAQNYGAKRNKGSISTGSAVLTFNILNSDIGIPKGGIITAKNGATFTAVNSVTVSTTLITTYQAIAAKYKSDLDFVGITDTYAVEILIQATASGIQGNISKYSLVSTSISGVSNVTNPSPIGGGSAAEDDATFRNRVLSIFSGANTGTSLGYRNAVTADSSVIDAIVIGPGNPLMTRDGTQVSIASDGTRTILSEGTGGKVDILVYGTRLQETTDSFIYHDLSNTNDPTAAANNFVLGQLSVDAGKIITRKRLDDLSNGILPNQPVNNIVSVTGSISGPNFAQQVIDSLGRSTGNYALVKDTGVYAGSPWGLDAIKFVSDRISNFGEDKTKTAFNGQDPFNFPDLLNVAGVQQNIIVTNENSTVSPKDRTSIQLSHTNTTSVTRVFNTNTGERYIVTNQNPDAVTVGSNINLTGRIIISGKSLPAVSDILQVDYTWIFNYDPYIDFDNRSGNSNPRIVQDSLDWGFSNAVRREKTTLQSSGSSLITTVSHPISTVISVNVFSSAISNVVFISNRLGVVITGASIFNIVSITRNSDGAELWNTIKNDGKISGLTIYLPTDSAASFNDLVNVIYNATDVFNTTTSGSFNNNLITIVPSTIAVAGAIVECNYISNVSTLLPSSLLSTLPAIRSNNTFNTNTISNIGTQPTTHIFSNNVISSNLRQAPSNLGITINGSISPGVITITGTTIFSVANIVYTVSSNSLKQDLSSAIKDFLNLNSNSVVPANVKISKLAKISRVLTTSSFDVLDTINTYDVLGYHLLDNSFVKSESVMDNSLKRYEVLLPSTPNNLSNIPAIGDRMIATFFISTSSDFENISFSKSGTLYTNKRFALIDIVAISSGFTTGLNNSSTLSISNLNQPPTRSRYKAFYDYLAPKSNERITIDYNFQKIISDATLAVENTRPITADVLVKSATALLVNVTINIVISESSINSSQVVLQNVKDTITASMNSKSLGTILDASDLIAAAYTVTGVDRARILYFNISNTAGSVLSIIAQNNQYIVGNQIIVNLETR